MPELTYSKVNRDILRTLETPGKAYFITLGCVLCVLGFGIFSWMNQIYTGLGMAGYSAPPGRSALSGPVARAIQARKKTSGTR